MILFSRLEWHFCFNLSKYTISPSFYFVSAKFLVAIGCSICRISAWFIHHFIVPQLACREYPSVLHSPSSSISACPQLVLSIPSFPLAPSIPIHSPHHFSRFDCIMSIVFLFVLSVFPQSPAKLQLQTPQLTIIHKLALFSASSYCYPRRNTGSNKSMNSFLRSKSWVVLYWKKCDFWWTLIISKISCF